MILLSEQTHLYWSVLELIEKAFNYPKEQSFEVDFYPLVEPKNHHNLHVIVDQDENVISHVGALIKTLKVNGKDFKCCFIGGIATEPKYRGQGHFSQLLSKVLRSYEDQVACFFLWSDLVDVYQKHDFFLAGGILHVDQHRGENTLFQECSLDQIDESMILDIKKIRENLSSQFLMFERNDHDWKVLRKIKSARLHYLKNDKNIVAYFIKGKGQDLKDIVHEYGALDSQSESLLYQELHYHKVWAPENQKSYFKDFDLQYLGLMRTGNLIMLKEMLLEILKYRIDIKDFSTEKVAFEFEGQKFESPLSEFVQYVIGPNPLEEFKDITRPFFISGIESV